MRGRMARLVACIASMLIWGASFVGTRVAYGSLTPLWLAFLRFAIASAVLLPYLALRHTTLPKGRSLLMCVASGIVGITCYYAAENLGVKLTSASVASIVTASFPAIGLLVEAAVRRTAPGVRPFIGALISLLGVAILTADGAQTGKTRLWGIAILIVAGVLWGLYNLLVQGAGEGTDVLEITGVQFLVGTVGFMPLLALEPVPSVPSVLGVWPALAFLSLGCSLAAYLFYNWALEGLSASTCSAMLNLIPIFGVVLSTVLLGETLDAYKIVAGIVTLAGIWVSASGKKDVAPSAQ